MQMYQTLSFREIPKLSRLFLEYLDGSAAASAFYRRRPSLEMLEVISREDLQWLQPARVQVADILRAQNSAYGVDAGAANELEKPECVAILTGQQVGLFTNPLYTLYKALTAIRIAQELRSRGVPAVPIFWMDTDDHDLAEVCRISTMAGAGSVHVTDCREALFGEITKTAKAVGSIELPASIAQVLADYLTSLPESGMLEQVRQVLEAAYRPGATFSQAFGKLMAALLGGKGLLLFDPRDPMAKRLAAPLFRKVLAEPARIAAELTARSQALLDAGFHAQVNIAENSANLFLDVDGERRLLTVQNGEFIPKNTDIRFGLGEILSLVENQPERFSPNVLMRPLVQDHLFPTVAYVGGPSEVAYFAQIEVLYRIFKRPMPIIWPRSGFTILDAAVMAAMQQYGIHMADCFQGGQTVLAKLLRESASSLLTDRMSDLRSHLEMKLDGIRSPIVSVDPTLGPTLDNAQRKILHQIESLQTKLVQYESRQHSQLGQLAAMIMSSCYPNGNLQEREFGLWPFAGRPGFSLLDRLLGQITLDSFAHQIVAL